jgi:hypothetical protein
MTKDSGRALLNYMEMATAFMIVAEFTVGER